MPEWRASSTPYWIRGLSTSGSISFGWALVAGRKRVPRPATGKTALRTMEVTGGVVAETDRQRMGRKAFVILHLLRAGRPSPDYDSHCRTARNTRENKRILCSLG